MHLQSRIQTFDHQIDEVEQVGGADEIAKVDGQPVADVLFQDFGTGEVERNGDFLSKSVIATFVNGGDESLFPQARKIIFSRFFLKIMERERKVD